MSSTQGKSRFWSDGEDAALVESMMELHNVGRYLKDGQFRPGHLKELQRLMEIKRPGCGLQGRPHIESRMKTLKKQFQSVHDMVSGVNSSGFGWDSEKNIVTADKPVWDAYIQSHREAAYFRHRSFPYYEDLCTIYAKDRATGNQAETFADAVDDMERAGHDNCVEEENFVNDNLGNDDDSTSMHSRAQQDQPTSSADVSSKKKRKIMKVDDLGASIEKASENLGLRIIESVVSLGQAFGRQEIYEKQKKLNEELTRTTTLTIFERHKATELISQNVARLNVFFSMPDDEKDTYVRALLNGSI